MKKSERHTDPGGLVGQFFHSFHPATGRLEWQGVIIGRMGRSLPNQNNVLTMAPALIATKADIDRIVGAIGNALAKLK